MPLRSAHCRPKAYIVAGMNFLPCIYCRQRQYVTKCATYSVAPVYNTLRGFWGRLYTERERERERERARERVYNNFDKFKILKFHVCVHPNVDGQNMIITR